jgi:manganese-dependent ADP-ribose/CDP-alcohol diphosphatase
LIITANFASNSIKTYKMHQTKLLVQLIIICSALQSFHFYSSGQSSIIFSGSDAYISVENSPEIDLSSFTVECWFMRKDTGESVITGDDSINAIPLIARGIEEDPGIPGMNYFLGIKSEGSILVAGFEESASGASPSMNHHITGYTEIQMNLWYHAAVTYDGSYIRLYLNGIQESALEIGEPAATGSPFNLGIAAVLDGSDMPAGSFNGCLDEIRIWNYARSQEEINDRINRELPSAESGLVLGLGLNEGVGDEVHYAGMPGLNVGISGTSWEWTKGSSFENLNPPPCNNPPVLKIGLIADPQYSDTDPSGTRYYRESLGKLAVAIDTMNKYEVDFVITLGDHIDRDYESFGVILPLYDDLDMPDYKLLGNHEFEYVEDNYHDTVLSLLDMPDYYYDFSRPGWRFIVLDGTELASYDSLLHPQLREEGDSLWQSVQGQINDLTWNGGIGKIQRSWLENRIQDAAASNENVIIFCHFPVYPLHELNLWNSAQMIEITEKYNNVVAYINGHNHEGNYGFLNGKHYITQKGMVETAGNNSFSILEVYESSLAFKNYGLMDNLTVCYRNPFKKPYDINLSGNTLTYAADSGDLAAIISVIDSSGSSGYSCGLTDTYTYGHNSLFAVSGDSLLLNTSQDISGMGPLSVKISAMNCYLDTVAKVFTVYFDTVATYLYANIPDTALILGHDTFTVDLGSFIADRSENGLAYTASSVNSGKAVASIDGGKLVVEPVAGGETGVIVAGYDSYTGQSVADTFNVQIVDPLNHSPQVISMVNDKVVNLNHDTLRINLDTIFFDPDYDTLDYALLLENDSTIGAALANSLLEIYPLVAGDNYIGLSADDGRGGYEALGFGILVNTMPEVIGSIPDLLMQEDDPSILFNLDSVFADKDNDSLFYEVNADDTAVLEVIAGEHVIGLAPVRYGHTIVSILASDGKGGTAALTFVVTVNGNPRLKSAITDMMLTVGGPAVHINLDTVYTDPDGDTLQYLLYAVNPVITDLELTGSLLSIIPLNEGSTNVEVSADDMRGGILSSGFNVTVSDIDLVYGRTHNSDVYIYPNPFSGKARLTYKLTANSFVRFFLCNQYGQVIKMLASGLKAAGRHDIYLYAGDLPPGIYFFRLETADRGVQVMKMVMCK